MSVASSCRAAPELVDNPARSRRHPTGAPTRTTRALGAPDAGFGSLLLRADGNAGLDALFVAPHARRRGCGPRGSTWRVNVSPLAEQKPALGSGC